MLNRLIQINVLVDVLLYTGKVFDFIKVNIDGF